MFKSDGNRAYSAIAAVLAISSGDAYKYPYGVNYTGNYALKLKMLVLRGIIAGFTLKLIHKN